MLQSAFDSMLLIIFHTDSFLRYEFTCFLSFPLAARESHALAISFSFGVM